MSDKSDALEDAVMELIEARTALEAAPSARERAAVDRAFARLASLAAPRIRYFTRAYGLSDCVDDAEQVSAIALHRAADRYNPSRARFTTYVTWQIRAELQALRLRLRGDPRCAARRQVGAMLSLDVLAADGDDQWLVDPDAEAMTERAAADELAALAADRLVAEWSARRRSALLRMTRGSATPERVAIKVAEEGALVRRQLMQTDTLIERLCEADRHIVRRAFADMARSAGAKPH